MWDCVCPLPKRRPPGVPSRKSQFLSGPTGRCKQFARSGRKAQVYCGVAQVLHHSVDKEPGFWGSPCGVSSTVTDCLAVSATVSTVDPNS